MTGKLNIRQTSGAVRKRRSVKVLYIIYIYNIRRQKRVGKIAYRKVPKKVGALGKMSKAENFQKKSKKRVDFSFQIWYSIKAPRERGYGSAR